MDTNNELESQKAKAMETLNELKRLDDYGWKGYPCNKLDHILFAGLKVAVKGKAKISLSSTSVSIYYKNVDGEQSNKRLIIPTGYKVDTIEKSKGVIDIDLVPDGRHYSLLINL